MPECVHRGQTAVNEVAIREIDPDKRHHAEVNEASRHNDASLDIGQNRVRIATLGRRVRLKAVHHERLWEHSCLIVRKQPSHIGRPRFETHWRHIGQDLSKPVAVRILPDLTRCRQAHNQMPAPPNPLDQRIAPRRSQVRRVRSRPDDVLELCESRPAIGQIFGGDIRCKFGDLVAGRQEKLGSLRPARVLADPADATTDDESRGDLGRQVAPRRRDDLTPQKLASLVRNARPGRRLGVEIDGLVRRHDQLLPRLERARDPHVKPRALGDTGVARHRPLVQRRVAVRITPLDLNDQLALRRRRVGELDLNARPIALASHVADTDAPRPELHRLS